MTEFTWARVAERSIEAYESMVAQRPARRRFRRGRVALATPWPRDQTRIADYNQRLATELGQHVDVDVIVGGPVDQYPEPQARGVRLIDARDMDQLLTLRQPDRLVYCMGNSGSHRHAYELLKRHRGAVVLHDIPMIGFYQSYADLERPADREPALADRMRAMYGNRLPLDATENPTRAPDRLLSLGVYMTREVRSYAEHCFVHSRSARDVLELERAPTDPPVPVSVLPFGIPPVVERRDRHHDRGPLIVSFGDVTEVRGTAILIDAFGLLSAELPMARFVITGNVNPDLRVRAAQTGVELLPNVSAERYVDLLRTADLAVQVRALFDDQEPSLVADCLAYGLPTVVTDIGWAGELPAKAVEIVPSIVSPEYVSDRIVKLLREPAKLEGLSQGALEHARRFSFARVAEAYLDALEMA